MQGVSIREFSRRDGCSDTLVHKALKRGSLVQYDDGSIDPSLVGTPWRKRTPSANSVQTEDAGLVSHAEAQRIKENYLARLRELEFEVKSGRLVDAETVEREVANLARGERDALLTLPSRIAPLLAAELGAEQVPLTIALERHVREFLTERSNPKLRSTRH